MSDTEKETIIEQLRTAIEKDKGNPFPYKGCRKLYALLGRKGSGLLDEGFIPDLAMYFADIMGFASDAKYVYRWTDERKALFVRWDKRDFFERYPDYAIARSYITEKATPDLYRDMVLYEELRVKIVHLFRLYYDPVE